MIADNKMRFAQIGFDALAVFFVRVCQNADDVCFILLDTFAFRMFFDVEQNRFGLSDADEFVMSFAAFIGNSL